MHRCVNKRWRTALLAMIMVAMPLTAQAGDSPQEPPIAPQAMAALRSGHNEEVLAITQPAFDRQLEREKDSSRLWFCGHGTAETLLYAAMGAKDHKAATVLLPDACDALFLRAYALINLQRLPEARSQLETLTRMAPFFSQYAVEYAFSVRASGDLDRALELYRNAAELASAKLTGQEEKHERATALRGVGFILTEKGDLDGAEKSYRDSLKDEPDSEVARHELTYIAQLKSGGKRQPTQVVDQSKKGS